MVQWIGLRETIGSSHPEAFNLSFPANVPHDEAIPVAAQPTLALPCCRPVVWETAPVVVWPICRALRLWDLRCAPIAVQCQFRAPVTACDSKSSFALPRACVSATTGQDLNICQNVKQCPGCRVERANTFSITMYICIDNCAIQHQVSGDYIARFSFSWGFYHPVLVGHLNRNCTCQREAHVHRGRQWSNCQRCSVAFARSGSGFHRSSDCAGRARVRIWWVVTWLCNMGDDPNLQPFKREHADQI